MDMLIGTTIWRTALQYPVEDADLLQPLNSHFTGLAREKSHKCATRGQVKEICLLRHNC